MSLFECAAKFCDRPYIEAPCGEGAQGNYSTRPIYREDGFDCVTLVNTAMTHYFCMSASDREAMAIRLNYYGERVDYLARFHFMSADWCPELTRLKIIKDLTPGMVGEDGASLASVANAYINRQAWLLSRTTSDLYLGADVSPVQLEQHLALLHAQVSTLSNVSVTTPYLTLSQVLDDCGKLKLAVFDQLPNDVIMLIVRPNWDLTNSIGTHLNVSHLGIIGRGVDEWQFIHASSKAKCVQQVALASYLRSCTTSKTIDGIALLGL